MVGNTKEIVEEMAESYCFLSCKMLLIRTHHSSYQVLSCAFLALGTERLCLLQRTDSAKRQARSY